MKGLNKGKFKAPTHDKPRLFQRYAFAKNLDSRGKNNDYRVNPVSSESGNRLRKMLPVKKRSGIGLSARRDFIVTHDVPERKARQQGLRQRSQRLVLDRFKGLSIATFEFYPDGKIITAATSSKTGNTRMPGPLQSRYKLCQLAIT